MAEMNLRLRLLNAALIDQASLAGAITAAQAAEVWLREDAAPVEAKPVRLALPAPAPVEPPPAPGAEIGHDTRSSGTRTARAAVKERRSRAAAKSEKRTVGAWVEETIEALRHVAARDGEIRSGLVALHLGIEPAAAWWRLRQLVAEGRVTAEGESIRRRYRLSETPVPPADDTTGSKLGEPEAVPAAPREASSVPARPRSEPPPLPQRSQPIPPRIDKVAPSLAVEFVSIDTVVRFLRSREFEVTGGPDQFRVDHRPRDAAWLLERANKLRETRGDKPFALGGPHE